MLGGREAMADPICQSILSPINRWKAPSKRASLAISPQAERTKGVGGEAQTGGIGAFRAARSIARGLYERVFPRKILLPSTGLLSTLHTTASIAAQEIL